MIGNTQNCIFKTLKEPKLGQIIVLILENYQVFIKLFV